MGGLWGEGEGGGVREEMRGKGVRIRRHVDGWEMG